jgi:lactate dehydrogenase-like 2-hydroxyacid dehydrogenase
LKEERASRTEDKECLLIRALQEGWIQGAGIDVFEEEPMPPDNPRLKIWTYSSFMGRDIGASYN